MTARKHAVAVVGCGQIRRRTVRAIRNSADLDLLAICDEDVARAAEVDVTAVCASLDRLLAGARLDALFVCTPTSTHEQIVGAALEAGISVCCEKPLAVGRLAASRLVGLAAERGLVLFIAFHRRYNSNLAGLRRSGIAHVEVSYLEDIDEHRGAAEWYLGSRSNGGGCVLDNGPNALDMVRQLLGDLSVTSAKINVGLDGHDVAAEVTGRSRAGAGFDLRLDWEYDGEVKQVGVTYDDGTIAQVDLLAGFPGFKASLDHEYDALVSDFVAHLIHGGGGDATDGLAISRLIDDVFLKADETA